MQIVDAIKAGLRSVIVSLGVAAAACVAPAALGAPAEPFPAIQRMPTDAASPVVIIGPSAAAVGAINRTEFRRIPAGVESEILLYFNLDVACGPLNYSVKVTNAARYGAIRLGKKEFTSTRRFADAVSAGPVDDARRKCSPEGKDAKLVSYIPLGGHVGKDYFTIFIEDRHFKNTIEIEVLVVDE